MTLETFSLLFVTVIIIGTVICLFLFPRNIKKINNQKIKKMTSRDFVYWLQGYFEISNATELNSKQIEIIQNHLNLVFHHEIDPSYGDSNHQNELQHIHDNTTKPNNLIRC